MTPKASSTRLAILTVFFVSGAAGLVYEVVWMRWLSLVFGVSIYAAATVLASFMGGLALGSYLFGRWIDRGAHPLYMYAALEAAIGVYALFVPLLFESLRGPVTALHQLELSYPLFAFLRALITGGVLLLPTVFMGGTFPILVRLFVERESDIGRRSGLLYFINTAGGVAGCLLAGFVLIENFGLRGTTYVAAAANFAVAAIAAGLAHLKLSGEERPPSTASIEGENPNRLPAVAVRTALVCIGVSGFASLAYEVLWTRALVRYLFNSTYAFTTMLSTFLAGIAVGSAIYTRWISRTTQPMLWFAGLQLAIGFGFVLSHLMFSNLIEVADSVVSSEVQGFSHSVIVMFTRAALILFLPTVFLGATLPLATSICTRGIEAVGHGLGRVYAVNTTGAILGSLGCSFALIPLLGMHGTLIVLVGLNLGMAALLVCASSRGPGYGMMASGLALVVLAVTIYALPSDLFRRTLLQPNSRFVFYEEGATDTIGVMEYTADWARGHRAVVYEDQRGTSATMMYSFNFFAGHLPLLLHPGTPREVLHICFGVGNSLSAAAMHSTVERIDNVELSSHVLEAGPYFWTNGNVLASPKVNTIVEDGRTFVMATENKYDVIMLEPPEIFTGGVINLYTRDFYLDAAKRLREDGVMLQWVPVGAGTLEDERMLFRAFSDAFPHATAWQQFRGGAILLIGTKIPLEIDYQRLARRMQIPEIKRDLDLIPVLSPDHLLSYFIFDESSLREFGSGVEPVTEDRTVLDFSMPRYAGSGFGFGSYGSWSRRSPTPLDSSIDTFKERGWYFFKNRKPVTPLLRNFGGEDPESVAERIEAFNQRPAVQTGSPLPPRDWKRPPFAPMPRWIFE
ncbi:fused MFS/spermidine synthase [Myxococcota bacterium]|nr:fused MFS/spermidine synthase [Myxococcota bacterium]